MTANLRITFVGHATLLIEMDGVRLLTDPILRDRVMHLRRHDKFIDQRWYTDIDAVLISHMHYDHLDLPSLRLMGDNCRFIVPRGMKALLERRGYWNVEEVGVDDSVQVGLLEIKATFADHDNARFRGGPKADTLGFLVSGSHTAYFPGDTDIFPEMKNISNELDVVLMPVWGWGPTLGEGHLDPYRAALALQLLKPRLAIPIHWGTLHPLGMRWLNPSFLFDPPHAFARHAARLAPEVEVHILEPGNAVVYNANFSG
jgi:L-ascorbate metabolism protein UlaG (beta-lactamase superfamily)